MSRLPLIAAAALFFSGCIATQRDVLEIENQADDLRVQVADLKKTVTSMQANQADLSVQIKQLREDLGAYTEAIKDSQDSMTQLSAKLDNMSANVASKVASIGSTLTAAQAKNLAEQKAALEKEHATLAQEQAALSNQGPSSTDLFYTAEVRLSKKNYALAAQGFEDYISSFPTGALIDVATYNLGQAYFGQKRYADAGKQFALLLEKYPKSDHTASGRLMYALSLIRLGGHLPEARQYLESIGTDFPTSPEAKAAARQLKKLKQS